MKQRDAILVLASVILAVGIAAILLVGTLSPSSPTGERGRFFQPGGETRVVPSRLPQRSGEVVVIRGSEGRSIPEAFRPLVRVERGIADAARDAAAYLLVLLAVAATLVLGHEQVVATYRASLGGWRTQARIVGAGVATIALLASATFLASVVFLGTLTGGFLTPRPLPTAGGGTFFMQVGLQTGFVLLSVVLFIVAIPALVGFAAAAWRLGDGIIGIRPFARWAGRIPAPLVALLGATVLYLATQVPYIGVVIAAGAIAYALGAVLTARLDSTSIRPTTREST